MQKIKGKKLGLGITAMMVLFNAAAADPIANVKVKKDFKIEPVYVVDKKTDGSWVSICVDDKGRLITSDQYGALYRITPSPIGKGVEETKVEKIALDIGSAQGLHYKNGSLYLQLNGNLETGVEKPVKRQQGLYKVSDSDGDDQFDKIELMFAYEEQAGEHGPHDVLETPDGKSLIIVTGNQSDVPAWTSSKVPLSFGEDNLLEPLIGKGFMKTVEAPRGFVAKISFDGKEKELLTIGFRNQYGAAYNREGDMFTYDADMEWDANTPWYRPTRICHVLSGSEFGWRAVSKKWPVRWEDSVPPVVDIGPGSPTGVCFGYGTKYPTKYQEAFYACDWSYGKLYAVHLKPEGGSYKAEYEEFLAGQPLPLTDVVVNPKDHHLYFTVGGRKTHSGLYRVVYTGSESTKEEKPVMEGAVKKLHQLRRDLEVYHGKADVKGLELAWKNLGHEDRYIRNAARIALEWQPVEQWAKRALSEKSPRVLLTAIMALARSNKVEYQAEALSALLALNFDSLELQDKITLVRDISLVLMRLGKPNETQCTQISEKLGKQFPNADFGLSNDVCELLVYVNDVNIVKQTVPLIHSVNNQDAQIAYAKHMRKATQGWTPELRKKYFEWFPIALSYSGGASFSLFMEDIKRDSIAMLTPEQVKELQATIDLKPVPKTYNFGNKVLDPTKGKVWTVADFESILNVGLEGGRDFNNGRASFGAVGCIGCHRFNGEGGALGPDLSSVFGKFGPRDLLESIIEPSKEISDQYGSIDFAMKDGSVVVGRVMNMREDILLVNTNMFDPNQNQGIKRDDIVSMNPSKVSLMPPGLVNVLSQDDILDMLAYLLSKGDPSNPYFKK
jgi:putative heme-binding domain-containing protein